MTVSTLTPLLLLPVPLATPVSLFVCPSPLLCKALVRAWSVAVYSFPLLFCLSSVAVYSFPLLFLFVPACLPCLHVSLSCLSIVSLLSLFVSPCLLLVSVCLPLSLLFAAVLCCSLLLSAALCCSLLLSAALYYSRMQTRRNHQNGPTGHTNQKKLGKNKKENGRLVSGWLTGGWPRLVWQTLFFLFFPSFCWF